MKLPYIIQESREQYKKVIDKMVLDLQTIDDDVSFSAIIPHLAEQEHILGDLLINAGVENQDGDLNYVMTKILKSLKIDDLQYYGRIPSTFISTFVGVIRYSYKPKYFNYNRALGVLTACRKEYERRNPNNCLIVSKIFNEMIDILYKYNIGPYEDTKIISNGDV